MDDVACTRCGYCCYFFADGKVQKCKHLVIAGKTTLCRIYNKPDRIGTEIYTDKSGVITRCTFVDNVDVNYPKCPYNARKNLKAGRELPMVDYNVPWIDKILEEKNEKYNINKTETKKV